MEILETEDEQSSSGEPLKLFGKVEFKNVSFVYPTRADFQVLKSISLTIEPGEKIALVGASGSGKSTITSLLMRLYSIREGAILVDDKNSRDYNLTGFRSNIGIVPQEVILFFVLLYLVS